MAITTAIQPHELVINNTVPFFIKPTLEDFFLYSGKQRPEIYLEPSVRDGISSFRNLCSSDELKQGLLRLKNDITSGNIHKIIKQYSNKIGDYLFVVLIPMTPQDAEFQLEVKTI